MYKRFACLFAQDLMIAIRNKFHLIILALGVVMVLLVNFIIPGEIKMTPREVFFDATQEGLLKDYVMQQGVPLERIFEQRQQLVDAVANDSGLVGIVMEGTLENARFTIYHQGNEAQETLRLLDASLEVFLAEQQGRDFQEGISFEYLGERLEPIPMNKRLVPLMIVLEAVMLGFLIIAVMVFQEKEEGGVRAYRVSPAGTMEYILSKASVNILLALLYTLMIIVPTTGLGLASLPVIPLVLLASLLMTLLGLLVSVFFRNLEEFLFVGVFILALLGLPMASYMNPSFAPRVLTLLPSYSILFGIRDLLFDTGRGGDVLRLLGILSIQCFIFLVLAYLAVHRRLMKEGR